MSQTPRQPRWTRWKQIVAEHPWRSLGQLAGVLAVLGALIFWRGSWSPDFVFVLFFFLFALFGKAREYAFRLSPLILLLVVPFVILLVSYDSLRPLAPFLTQRVHAQPMIAFDRWLGHGTLPEVWLQQHLYHPQLSWYDYYFYGLYICHFLTPFLMAIALWQFAPQHYNRFAAAFLVLSYAGFATFAAYPTAPPWMASQLGLIPHVQQIADQLWLKVGVHNFPSLLDRISPDEVASVPSLHAAYPMLVLLFIWRAFGRRAALAFSWYPFSMWFGIVYLGEHYVFDTLAGIGYAVASYGAVNWFFDHYGARLRRFKARWEPAEALPVAQPAD